MGQKSDIRYSIDTRIKLARLTERIDERCVLVEEVKELLRAFETSTEEYDEFERFICLFGDKKQIKRTDLYDEYFLYCQENKIKPQTRFWFGKQLRLNSNIRIYKLNGYDYLDIMGINESP